MRLERADWSESLHVDRRTAPRGEIVAGARPQSIRRGGMTGAGPPGHGACPPWGAPPPSTVSNGLQQGVEAMAWGHRVYSWQVSVRFFVGRQRMKRNTQVVRARPDRRPAAPPPALGGPAAVAAAAIAASGGVGGVSPPPLAATCDASAASRRVVRLASRCRVSARGDRLGATRADGFFDYEQGATGVVGGLDRRRRGGGKGTSPGGPAPPSGQTLQRRPQVIFAKRGATWR